MKVIQKYGFRAARLCAVLIFLSSLSLRLNAQTYFSENFSSNTMPPQGWSMETFSNQQYIPWKIDYFNNFPDAGGAVPEGLFIYYLQAEGTSRLISPPINLGGVSSATLSFKHKLSLDAIGPSFGIATRSGNGPWMVAWQMSPQTSLPADQQNVVLDNLGQNDFQFCFFVTASMTTVGWWAIDDIRLFSPANVDARISSPKVARYVEKDSLFPLSAVVSNQGQSIIQSFDFSYSINGGIPKVKSYTGLNLELGDSMQVLHDSMAVLEAPGNAQIEMFVSAINGGIDSNQGNNSLSQTVSAVSFRPQKMVLAELVTGTWCGYCVRSSCFMDYMAQTYPDNWIGVAIHNNDAMMCVPYNNAVPDIIPDFDGGYPSATSDRTRGNDLPDQLEARYLERIAVVSPASIAIKNYNWNPLNRQLSFEIESEFAADIDSELRFGAIVLEDSITGFSQANNYSGGNTPMCGLENLPNPIPPSMIHFDHVARAILPDPAGTPGSLPALIATGEIHSRSYNFTIPFNWNYQRISIAGFLLNAVSGEVLNATNKISSYLRVPSAEAGNQQFAVSPNPFSDFLRIKMNVPGPVSSYRIADISGKTVLKGMITSGELDIETKSLPKGIYLMHLDEYPGRNFRLAKY